ncbi:MULTISPECIES: hypothetical protein [Rodentibacter]|uniref:Uncharacterized protein n=1 Tax=Rodentibacter ratti TaxID=1906745 RepID=A0A1V3L5G3_9PAST|nr:MULTISPECIES: hypothetical protein [Rodentibacter]OOF85095.1 hypothetical protein BKG88_09015 [Rodentibacter ratti]
MKKATADFLAYEFTKARFTHSNYPLNQQVAREIALFIQTLSLEFQNNLDDFDESTLERFKHLSK